MKINLPSILSAFGGILLFAFSIAAQVASNPPFALEQTVIAGGGGTSSGSADGAFSITGTVGQAVAGVTSTNSPFAVSGGFFTAQAVAPTAAGVTVSGRVQTANGKGIRNVIITLTTADGATRATLSGASGRYSFTDVAAGQTVVLSARAKRFSFSQPTLVLSLTEEAGGIDFIGIGGEFSIQ